MSHSRGEWEGEGERGCLVLERTLALIVYNYYCISKGAFEYFYTFRDHPLSSKHLFDTLLNRYIMHYWSFVSFHFILLVHTTNLRDDTLTKSRFLLDIDRYSSTAVRLDVSISTYSITYSRRLISVASRVGRPARNLAARQSPFALAHFWGGT